MCIFFGYILADFIMGVYHWIKDTYFGPFTPIIGKKFIWGSRLHHVRPRYVTEFNDFYLAKSSGLWTLIWMGPVFYFFGIGFFNLSLFLTICMNDVVHKYAHMMEVERPFWIIFLQKIYLFQSYEEHHLHHVNPHEVNYCPITPYVNFYLEKINFWRLAENFIEKFLGYEPRAKVYDFVEDSSYPAGIRFIE